MIEKITLSYKLKAEMREVPWVTVHETEKLE